MVLVELIWLSFAEFFFVWFPRGPVVFGGGEVRGDRFWSNISRHSSRCAGVTQTGWRRRAFLPPRTHVHWLCVSEYTHSGHHSNHVKQCQGFSQTPQTYPTLTHYKPTHTHHKKNIQYPKIIKKVSHKDSSHLHYYLFPSINFIQIFFILTILRQWNRLCV